jgi:hypothetical protein
MAYNPSDPYSPIIDGSLDGQRPSVTQSITNMGSTQLQALRQLQQAVPALSPDGALAKVVGSLVRTNIELIIGVWNKLSDPPSKSPGVIVPLQQPPPAQPVTVTVIISGRLQKKSVYVGENELLVQNPLPHEVAFAFDLGPFTDEAGAVVDDFAQYVSFALGANGIAVSPGLPPPGSPPLLHGFESQDLEVIIDTDGWTVPPGPIYYTSSLILYGVYPSHVHLVVKDG